MGVRANPAGWGLAGWMCGLAVGLALSPLSVSARAPVLPGLSWVRLVGSEACISSVGLAQRVEDKLGRSVFVPTSAAEITIEGYVTPRADGGFDAQLSVVAMDGRVLGTRELQTTGNECSELDDALTLVIAVTLDPAAGMGGVSMLSPEAQAALDEWLSGEVSESTAIPDSPPATVPVPRRVVDLERPASPEEASVGAERGVAFDVALIGGAGMLPMPAFGLEAGVRLVPEGFLPVSLLVQAFWPSLEAAPNFDPRGDVRLILARAGALLCPMERSGSFSVEGCIGLDAGFLYAESVDYLFNNSAVFGVVDALLQVNLRIWASPSAAVRVGLSAALPVTPVTVETRLSTRATVDVFAMSPVTVALHVGATFPL